MIIILSQIGVFTRNNFRTWHKNPRIYICFSLAFIASFLLSDKIIKLAEEKDTVLQITEPFIWTFGDSTSILLISLFLILLFADMPFLDKAVPFYLVRSKRMVWLLGQILYIFLSCTIYACFILCATAILSAYKAYGQNTWSDTAALLAYTKAGEELMIPSARRTLESGSPLRCAGYTFLLLLLYILFLSLFMMAINLLKGVQAAISSVFVLSILEYLMSSEFLFSFLGLREEESFLANVWIIWLSPLNQAVYKNHSFGWDLLPGLQQTGIYYACLITACFLLCLRLIRHYSFSFTGTPLM